MRRKCADFGWKIKTNVFDRKTHGIMNLTYAGGIKNAGYRIYEESD